LKCNKFGESSPNTWYDIAVTSNPYYGGSGIKKLQGSDDDNTTPAGNMFSHYPPTGNYSDYYNECLPIFYFQHDPDPVELEIIDYNDSITKMPTNLAYVEDESCEPSTKHSSGEVKSLIAEYDIKADSVDILLDAVVDGGNTPALESEVATSTPAEAYSVYSNLMMKSPYLTDTVMIEAIDKEDVLNEVMVTDVLVSNPQSAKSTAVMEELDSRMNPLPDYMLDEIKEGKDTLGLKELMESAKSYYRHQEDIHFNLLKCIYSFDTLYPDYADSLIALLQTRNTVKSQYELSFYYLQNGAYEDAANTFSNIPNCFALDERQQQEYISYQKLMPVLEFIYSNDCSEVQLDSNKLDTLFNIYADSSFVTSMYAQNILVNAGVLQYEVYCILPDTGLKAENLNAPQRRIETEPPLLKVYPNPASKYITIEYNIEDKGCSGELLLLDNLGKVIRSNYLKQTKNSTIIPTNNLVPGLYYVYLNCNGQVLASEKIIILH
jgi:hypothetical protein